MAWVENFLEGTVDLRNLDVDDLLGIVADKKGLDALRYLASPPISKDDLKTLANIETLAPSRLRNEPRLVHALAQVVKNCIDRRRFPWFFEDREPTEAERHAAVLASATLIACQHVETDRRSIAKANQEGLTQRTLEQCGFVEVPKRKISTLGDAPTAGEFCGESKVGTRKADLIAGLWDQRKLLIECKVSNSEVNSVKRLNNDAAIKAKHWREDFGTRNVVPAAMLSGVYKLKRLQEAQDRGLALFWAHAPTTLSNWLDRVRTDAQA